MRGLTNIAWEQRSLLDLPGSGLGPFDYIDCCGVLHHLPDPAEGLRALLSVLAPGGGLGLMVYAPHGRTGVYMVQDALRLLAPAEQPPAVRLDVARRVMRHLPETAWLRLNPNFGDHVDGGDAGLYDLLLNPRDRAFTVPDLHALLAGAGLEVACWVEPARYDPVLLLPDPKLRARIEALDPIARAALAEALAGNMSVHIVYAVRAGEAAARADPFAADAVPVARELPGEELARSIGPDGTLTMNFDGLRIPLPAAAAGAGDPAADRRPAQRGRRSARRWPSAGPAPRRSPAPGAPPGRRWSGSTACCWRRRRPDELVSSPRSIASTIDRGSEFAVSREIVARYTERLTQ